MAIEPTEGHRMMRRARGPIRARGWAGVVVVLLGAALVGGLVFGCEPRRELERRVSTVVSVAREPRADLGPRVERWRIVTAAGDTLEGLWRGAPPASRSPWTIVLLGGIGTDDRAALLVPPEVRANVLAMSWPWSGPQRMSTARFLAELPAIRDGLLRSPAVLAAGVEAVVRERGPGRIALLGASLGVPPAIAASSLTESPRALILLDGGADLAHLLRHELGRQRVAGPLGDASARLGAWLLAPLEPRRHARSLSTRRVLYFSARHDGRMPAGSAARLHALTPHATVTWREGAHIRPSQSEVIAEIAARSVRWLERSPAAHGR